ncbi:response regulator [Colwellia sp. M166]|uniref:response regulator n=1 Tax=Colwellia sp. M166 TaxID=2583805 RepID=UPI00211EE1A6|nr:response regulator [Colwellia sp. M166]UUO24844.1 response regulator [Colwellia sp. M166]|tara:strand:+ start:777 stop:2147 length:1371 start_codon:yes stop_codon:yes gene_type:complete
MKTKSTPFSTRHPKVVMVFEKEDDISGISAIISNNINEYRAIPLDDETNNFLDETKPSIIIFALSTVDQCIEYYSELLADKHLKNPHFAILLCKNKESGLAFRCCMKGLFDNYFIFQPLFEKLRLLMIIQSGLVQCKVKDSFDEFNNATFEQFDENITKLIDESSQCKRDLLDRLNKLDSSIVQVEQKAEQLGISKPKINHEPLSSSPQELISSIKQNCVEPLLKHLEDDIKTSLDNIIQQLLTQQIAMKTAATKSKGLIHHVPSIKKRNTLKEELHNEQDQEKHAEASGGSKGLIHHTPSLKKRDEAKDLTSNAGESEQCIAPITEAAATERNKKKVLIVEDNALYRELLKSVLGKESYEITEAEDGLQALKIIKDNTFDLIIMDLFMPNLDGLNATKQIRQLSQGIDIPVIALTGNKNKENVKKWAHYGLKGYIIKPSNREEILKTVRSALING